ncbi:hypothetical protein V4C53_14465 [Paraburkholderia azotifigens]|uniref:hypothetical protein n=1 Tax=Paraburkholderia azotifigens TaxID=2057004 RepID=UPI003173F83D
MSYIYRYDPLTTHLRMHGDMLRARRWSFKEGSWAHEPLIEAENCMSDGRSIFRISFWKSLEAAKLRIGYRLWSEMHVLQRVREDHPFFAEYTRIDDDHMPNAAWLYWRSGERESGQEWSEDGIPKSDIEVLDLDGKWRPMLGSGLMASSHTRYARLGFRPHYFQTSLGDAAVVFWTSRLFSAQSGDTYVALLVTHPRESKLRIYNDRCIAQSIVDQYRASGSADIPAERLRMFVVDEGDHTYDHSHLVEIPLSGRWIVEEGSRWRMCLPWRQTVERASYVVQVAGLDNWRWNTLDNALGIAVMSTFELATVEQALSQYRAVLDEVLSDYETIV